MYQTEAASLGLSLGECKHNVREFSFKSLPGDYRRLLVRPKQLDWKLLTYSDLQQDLAYTDLDALLDKPKPAVEELESGEASFSVKASPQLLQSRSGASRRSVRFLPAFRGPCILRRNEVAKSAFILQEAITQGIIINDASSSPEDSVYRLLSGKKRGLQR